MVNLYIRGGHLEVTHPERLTTGSVRFYELSAEFDNAWNNADKYAVFYQTTIDNSYEIPLENDNTVKIPKEVLVANLPLYLGFYGVVDNTRITTNFVTLQMEEGAYNQNTYPLEDISTVVRSLETRVKYVRINTDNEFQYSTDGETWYTVQGGGSEITVDDELSTTSENPVQNKVITTALTNLDNNKASTTYVDGKETALSDRIAVFENNGAHDVGALENRVGTNETNITSIESDISTIEADILNIENDIESIGTDITTIKNKPAYNITDTQITNWDGIDDKIDENVVLKPENDIFAYEDDTVTYTQNYKNLDTGETDTYSENIQLANDETAGMMSPSDYQQIRNNSSRIEALEGQTKRLLYNLSLTPTAQEISSFVTSQGYTENLESIAVVVSITYHIWHYYTNQGWKDDGIDTVNTFTNQVAGIIKGAQTDGKVYAETDGTGSVYGWSGLKTRVTNAENDLANKVDKITGKGLSTNDYTNIDKEKLEDIEDGAQVNVLEGVKDSAGDDLTITDKKVQLSKGSVGLGNVDNTSDLNKPISTATQTALNAKQATLVSGTNIKTINSNSLLGSGNITIQGGADVVTISSLSGLFTNSEYDLIKKPDTLIKYTQTGGKFSVFRNAGYDTQDSCYHYVQCGYDLNTAYTEDMPYGTYLVRKELIISQSKSFGPNTEFIERIICAEYDSTSELAMSGKAVAQAISTKQNTISDLSSIRSGSALGATALQSVPSEYITETELEAHHDTTKQDTLTTPQLNAVNSGITSTLVGKITTNETNISTINGKIPTAASSTNKLTDKTYVDAQIQDVREVAEGKNKNFVISDENNITGTKGSDGSYTNVTAITGITLSELKLGDNILVVNVNQPDFWVSQLTPTISLHILETAKQKVTDVKVNGTSVVSNTIAEVTVPQKTSDLTNDSGFITNNALTPYRTATAQDTIDNGKVPTTRKINNKPLSGDITLTASDISGFATVATSGNYNDLTNKPTIPLDSFFRVDYGVTTYTQIAVALNQGLFPYISSYSNHRWYYTKFSGGWYYFSNIIGTASMFVKVNSSNTWETGSSILQDITNRVQSISSSSATTEYPSAKAVYDFVKANATFQTTAPTSAVTDGGIHIVYLTSEPATKYDGYIYLIKE